MGTPDRAVVSSFYRAPVARDGVAVVPTLLRPEVLRARPRTGDHLLVYLNRARHQLTPRLAQALGAAGVPCVLYGANREAQEGAIRLRRFDRIGFVEDLASCRAVLSTAGNQLVVEAMHLGKPILVMPEASAEQHLNAAALERLGAGRWLPAHRLDAAALRSFLEAADVHAAAARRLACDGTDAALTALDRFARELCGKPLLSRAAAA